MAKPRKNSRGKWVADYRDPQGTRRMPEFKTMREAQAHLDEVQVAKSKGTYVDPKQARRTDVGQLWAKWIEKIQSGGARGNRPASLATLNDYTFNYEHYIKPTWQYVALSNITHAAVQEWLANLKTPINVATGRGGAPASAYAKDRAVKHFTRLLDHALTLGMLGVNPARSRTGAKIATPEVTSAKVQVRLTLAQLVRLSACAGEWRSLILFTGVTGLRWGEVSTLRRKHIQFGPTPSAIVESRIAKNRHEREVPIPRVIADPLESLHSNVGDEALIFPSPKGIVLDGKNFANRYYKPAGRLAGSAVSVLQAALGVTDQRSRVKYEDGYRQVSKFGPQTLVALHHIQADRGLPFSDVTTVDLWRALGLPQLESVRLSLGDQDFPPPTFHNLRHTAVALAINAGANIKLVQRIAGHASAEMNLDVYAELFDENLHSSAATLNGMLLELPGFSDGD